MRKVTALMVVVSFVFLSGCATFGKKKDMEIQGLKNQISVLESQVQSKDEEINGLKDSLSKASVEKQEADAKVSVPCNTKSRPNAKQIQTALLNAGYYAGAIDGKLGKQAREAIKNFQKANNLPADGKVGKKTWMVLRKHLDQKVK